MAKDLRPAPIVASWIQVPSSHAAPWIFPFFQQLHRTKEERLRASVAWFVDCYTSSLPLAQPVLLCEADAHNFKIQLLLGRQVKFPNVLNAEHLEDVDLIGTHRVILEPDGSPVTLWTLHFNQAQNTSTENITMVLGRSMNQEFSELQKPAAHTILMLDQADESPMLYKFVWDTNLVVPGIKTGYQKGQPVRCIDNASCAYCNYREGNDTSKGEAFKASRKPFQHKGEEEFMVHETKLRVVYVPDRKSLYLILSIHSSWDNCFKLNLRDGKHTSWMDDDPSKMEGMCCDLSTLKEANQLITHPEQL